MSATPEYPERYLGDGVYATFDGYQVWLDCRAQSGFARGPSGSPSIALEPSVLGRLLDFYNDSRKEQASQEAV
jgi:hypothetical protein